MRNLSVKRSAGLLLLLLTGLLPPAGSWGATNQFGETGLLSAATTDTVGNGNLCVGLWANVASMESGDTQTLMPLSMTFGMSKDLEINLSYPSLLFNDDTDESDRGAMNIGFKYRLLGTNRSAYGFTISAAALKPITTDRQRSDTTDYEEKALLGLRGKYVKLYLGGGVRQVDDPLSDDQTFVSGAMEFSFHRRFRIFVEGEQRTGTFMNGESLSRVTPGVQIFLTPHLTFTGGVDLYGGDSGMEQRVVAGLSTCGGLGEYIVPIPKPPKPIIAELEKPRGKPPVPLLPAMIVARREMIEAEGAEPGVLPGKPGAGEQALVTATRFEVPVEAGEEIALPATAQAGMVVVPAAPPIAGIPPLPPSVEVLEPERPVTGRVLRKFRLPESMFDAGKWQMSVEAEAAIGAISAELMSYKETYFVMVVGHTDSIGSESFNEKISLQRASMVAQKMMTKFGVPPAWVFIEGAGESKPIATNETPDGRSLNRRVEILLIMPKK